MEESQLIREASRDAGSFDQLYRRYFDRINGFVYHRVQDETSRREIVSNVFYKAMNGLDRFRWIERHRNPFAAWLYRIAINEINLYYRKQKRDDKLAEKVRFEMTPEPEKEMYSVSYEQVRVAMEELDHKNRDLIALRFFEKMKIKQIAQILHIRQGTAKVRIHRAVKALREILRRNDDAGQDYRQLDV